MGISSSVGRALVSRPKGLGFDPQIILSSLSEISEISISIVRVGALNILESP